MEFVAAFRSEPLTLLFGIVTRLGGADIVIAALTLGYWLLQPRAFSGLVRVALGTTLLNVILKELFQVPRPEVVPHLVEATGWSFPSGHSQLSAAVATWVALEWRDIASARWGFVVAALIALSRVYLGVHTPLDVSVGLLVGATFAGIAWRLSHPSPRAWQDAAQSTRLTILAGTGLFAVIALSREMSPHVPALPAFITGFLMGEELRGRWLGFEALHPTVRPKAFALGAALALPAAWGVARGYDYASQLPAAAGATFALAIGGAAALALPFVFRTLSPDRAGPGDTPAPSTAPSAATTLPAKASTK